MTDALPALKEKAPSRRAQESHHHDEYDYLTRLYRPVASAVNKAMKTYWDVVEGAVDIARKPSGLMKYSTMASGWRAIWRGF